MIFKGYIWLTFRAPKGWVCFYYFVGLALKGLKMINTFNLDLQQFEATFSSVLKQLRLNYLILKFIFISSEFDSILLMQNIQKHEKYLMTDALRYAKSTFWSKFVTGVKNCLHKLTGRDTFPGKKPTCVPICSRMN